MLTQDGVKNGGTEQRKNQQLTRQFVGLICFHKSWRQNVDLDDASKMIDIYLKAESMNEVKGKQEVSLACIY